MGSVRYDDDRTRIAGTDWSDGRGEAAQVLDYVRSIEEPAPTKTYTARELMAMSPEERNLLVIQALERSADEDVELLDVFDEMDDESSPIIPIRYR